MRAWWREKLGIDGAGLSILAVFLIAAVVMEAGWSILGWAIVASGIFLTVLYARSFL